MLVNTCGHTLSFPFLSLPPRFDFYGFRHKLVTRDFEAFSYFIF